MFYSGLTQGFIRSYCIAPRQGYAALSHWMIVRVRIEDMINHCGTSRLTNSHTIPPELHRLRQRDIGLVDSRGALFEQLLMLFNLPRCLQDVESFPMRHIQAFVVRILLLAI